MSESGYSGLLSNSLPRKVQKNWKSANLKLSQMAVHINPEVSFPTLRHCEARRCPKLPCTAGTIAAFRQQNTCEDCQKILQTFPAFVLQ